MSSARFNGGKPRLGNIFLFGDALRLLAKHMDSGCEKYADATLEDGRKVPNWMLGGAPDREFIDAASRHLSALALAVLTEDKESEVEFDDSIGQYTSHAIAAVWNLLVFLTMNRQDEVARLLESPAGDSALAWYPDVHEVADEEVAEVVADAIEVQIIRGDSGMFHLKGADGYVFGWPFTTSASASTHAKSRGWTVVDD